MKKKVLMLIIFGCLVVGLCGCTSTSEKNSDSSSGVSSALSGSLTGADLLNSVSLSIPDQYKLTKSITTDSGETLITTEYYKANGDKKRSEQSGGGMPGKIISIQNGNEVMGYSFVEGESTGTTKPASKVSWEMDQKMKSWGWRVESLPADFIARVETLNGEKVIYLEWTAQSMNLLKKEWLSMVDPITLKSEEYIDGSLTVKSETEFSTDVISDSLFIPPSDITFTEIGK